MVRNFLNLIPVFDAHKIFVAPWTESMASYGWVVLMGIGVGIACGLIGNYLILRRMALMGDAISHSILPGIAGAFLVSRSRSTWVMFLGALLAGILTSFIIELIHRRSRVKQDAAIGVAFSTLFAVGVIMIAVFADRVDLDQDCVLYGEIGFVSLEPSVEWLGMMLGPASILRMGAVCLGLVLAILLFYKELLVSSFDPGLSRVIGIRSDWVHHALTAVLSLVIVSAFEAVGAILVIAMLILPGATASLLTQRLPSRLMISIVHAIMSSVLGMHLAVWLDCSIASAMVLSGAFLFVLAWGRFCIFDRVWSGKATRLTEEARSEDV